ncbi:MAG: DegQ family serine endoprotease [Alphaproteobacteria bacterium]
MKIVKYIGLVFCLITFSTHAHANTPSSFADLAEKLLPAVVNISSTQKPDDTQAEMPNFPPGSPFEDFFEDFMGRPGMGEPQIPQAAMGSGFVIDAEKGYIITNNHVISDASEVRVTFHDDETLTAEVIGRDEKTDIAVLKVKTDKPLTAVPFGNSDSLRVGDWIVAIGNPFGLGGTVTAGIISARQRDINSGPYDDYLQTDASINRGNSGGPMFNLNGEVIGINTAIFSPTGGSVGIGFAIPSALASPVIDQIIEYGRTRRGWIGVRIQTVTDEIAESLGLDKARGAMVASVTENGPAAKAKLKLGDIILDFNGRNITEMRELPRIVAETNINSTANITYWRNGKKHKAKLSVAELEKAEEEGLITADASSPPSRDEGITIDELGLTLLTLDDATRGDYGIQRNINGVIIDNVDISSEAARKGLDSGDVIIEINQTPISTPEAAKDIIAAAKETGRASILLLINRDGDVRFVALKLVKGD